MARKNRVLALILSFFAGFVGADRFYLGKVTTGILKLITVGGFGIWWAIDSMLLLVDAFLYSLGKDSGFVKDKGGMDLKYGLCAYRFKNGSFKQDWFTNHAVITRDPLTDVSNETTQKTWLGRNWKWAIPLTFVCFFVAVFTVILSFMKSSEVYKISLLTATHDSRVIEKLGYNISDAFFVSGEISDSAATIKIPVSGTKGSGDIYIKATNATGRWEYQTFILHTDDENIDLSSAAQK